MNRKISIIGIVLVFFITACGSVTRPSQAQTQTAAPQVAQADEHSKPGGIRWEGWSDDIFERAKRENRLVILDLEAVWCHWCHVMAKETYSDPEVIKLIGSRYIAVKVDQDSRPDLSNRYEDYGWPATIVFDSNGQELAKRSGYIPPRPMATMLQAFIDDPTPGPSVGAEAQLTAPESAFLTDALRKDALQVHMTGYDTKYGSWGFIHKYLEWDSVEYSMMLAKDGDKAAEQRAKKSLAGELNLIDPVWGGVYQYSTGGVWTEPHFEKIMSHQAENLRIYSQAYALWKDPVHLKAAQDIHKFLKNFLTSPEGAYYTSMDADLVRGEHSEAYFKLNDAGRRKLGIPRVDQHVYARENGWAITGVVSLYAATGDAKYLTEALTAANWIVANRSLPDGGFRHDAKDAAGPYMGDTLAMGRAFLALYSVTGDRDWLKKAEAAAQFIGKTFSHQVKGGQNVGFETAKPLKMNPSRPQRDENIVMARFSNLLFHYSGKEEYRKLAEQAMRFLVNPDIATRRPTGGTLLTDLELAREPVHITVVGAKDDPQAQALFRSAMSYPIGYKRVEWFDRREGALPNNQVEFPELPKAAAFACAGVRCSLPVFEPKEIRPMVERLK